LFPVPLLWMLLWFDKLSVLSLVSKFQGRWDSEQLPWRMCADEVVHQVPCSILPLSHFAHSSFRFFRFLAPFFLCSSQFALFIIVHCAQCFSLVARVVFGTNYFSPFILPSQCKDAVSNFPRGNTCQKGTRWEPAMAWTRTECLELQPELAHRYAANKTGMATLPNFCWTSIVN
jgi:hypothetical protein